MNVKRAVRPLPTHSNRLLVVVGPSGAGKDSVLAAWLSSMLPVQRPYLAQRVITRSAGDSSEAHEVADAVGFDALIEEDALAFYWGAHSLRYGIRWTEFDELSRGRWVAMNGSRAHLPVLRQLAPQAVVIEIAASQALRGARLNARGREVDAVVQERLLREVPEVDVDWRLQNEGTLEEAVTQLRQWWAQAQPRN